MLIKIYRIRPISDDVKMAMLPKTHVDIVARSIRSAWGQFVRLYFGALKPDPAEWDVHLDRTESR